MYTFFLEELKLNVVVETVFTSSAEKLSIQPDLPYITRPVKQS
jgi:hypothetical protein